MKKEKTRYLVATKEEIRHRAAALKEKTAKRMEKMPDRHPEATAKVKKKEIRHRLHRYRMVGIKQEKTGICTKMDRCSPAGSGMAEAAIICMIMELWQRIHGLIIIT